MESGKTGPDGSVRCVLFDMDGVLLDTEPFYTRATQEIVSEWGKTFDWSVKSRMIGRPSSESAKVLVEALDLPISPQEYLQRRAVRLEELFRTSREIPGAEAFTRGLAGRGVPQAVATSSERRLFEVKISSHQDWFSVFGAVITGDDERVCRGKPAPDIFLVAAEAIGVDPAECVVLEDSPAGVEAALAAGMRVVAMPDPAMDRAPYEAAHAVVSGYADITDDVLGLAFT